MGSWQWGIHLGQQEERAPWPGSWWRKPRPPGQRGAIVEWLANGAATIVTHFPICCPASLGSGRGSYLSRFIFLQAKVSPTCSGPSEPARVQSMNPTPTKASMCQAGPGSTDTTADRAFSSHMDLGRLREDPLQGLCPRWPA